MKYPSLLPVAIWGATFLSVALLGLPVGAQPLPVESTIVKVNNLSLKEVAPDEAEKLAMPAKPIALRLRDVTLESALRELQAQSGVALDFSYASKGILDKKLALDFDSRFFRPAFDAIMDEAGVKAGLQRYGRDEAYNVRFGQMDENEGDGPQAGIGPFQVRLVSVDSNFRETVKPSAKGQPTRSRSRDFSISFGATLDPIVDVTGTPLFILKRVEDDAGRSLLDTNNRQWVRYDFDNSWSYARSQPIKTPATGVKTLARVEGVAVYVVPFSRQRWEIADVQSKDASHEFESNGQTVRVEVKSAARGGKSVEMTIEMTAPGDDQGGANPLFEFGQMSRVFRLEDAGGTVLRSSGYSGSSGGGKATMRTEFYPAKARQTRFVDGVPQKTEVPELVGPFKLVFDGPTEWVQTEVPFSFKDVPLP